jgi:hypothetical protein
MRRQSSRASRSTTVQDTVAVLGLSYIFYLMFVSVAASREPDWPMFWFAAAALILGVLFYRPCVRVIQDLLDEQRTHSREERFGTDSD